MQIQRQCKSIGAPFSGVPKIAVCGILERIHAFLFEIRANLVNLRHLRSDLMERRWRRFSRMNADLEQPSKMNRQHKRKNGFYKNDCCVEVSILAFSSEFLYSEGVIPVTFLNVLLNVVLDANPASSPIETKV